MKNWIEYIASEVMISEEQEDLIKHAAKFTRDKIECGKVLCVGVGDGTELEYFIGAEGIDLNGASIRKCREKGFNVRKMDMHKMTFPNESYDTIFCKDVFEHAVSPIIVLEEFVRVAKKYVVIVLPDEAWQSDGFHLIIPTLKQMISLAEKVRLSLLAYREYNLVINNGSSVFQHLYIFQK